MEKIGRKFDSFSDADKAEDEYYKNLSADERVDILLQLIAQYGHLFNGSAKGFERIYRVAPLEES